MKSKIALAMVGLLTHCSLADVLLPTTWSYFYSRAGETWNYDSVLLEDPVLPFSGFHAASNAGVSSTTYYDLTCNGNAYFDLGIAHDRSSIDSTFTRSNGRISFLLSEDMQYELNGFYSTQGWGRVHINVKLQDITTDQTIYLYQLDTGQNIEDGNYNLSGDLIGTLDSGHYYQWTYWLEVSSSVPSLGCLASGSLSLHIVPEPNSLVLWIAFVFMRKR